MKIVRIGRSRGNDINLPADDLTASKYHCQIIQEDDGSYTLVDVGSTNGTYVNGVKRHGQVKLNRNDIVRAGNQTLPWQTYFTNDGGGGGTQIGPDGGGYPPPMPPMTKPDNYLVWAILEIIFCSILCGIFATINASKVDGLWNAGDYAGATEAARKAKTWFWWGFGLGLVRIIVTICLELLVGVL
jgi:hypothetical protein